MQNVQSVSQCVMFACKCVFLSLMADDKLNDQYVVQRPSARASRRKDEFIWYDKTSGELREETHFSVTDSAATCVALMHVRAFYFSSVSYSVFRPFQYTFECHSIMVSSSMHRVF